MVWVFQLQKVRVHCACKMRMFICVFLCILLIATSAYRHICILPRPTVQDDVVTSYWILIIHYLRCITMQSHDSAEQLAQMHTTQTWQTPIAERKCILLCLAFCGCRQQVICIYLTVMFAQLWLVYQWLHLAFIDAFMGNSSRLTV